VRKEGDKVAKDAKQGVTKAGDQLTRLEGEVNKSTVKSGAELKRTFAQVDDQLAKALGIWAGS
jgi:mRNA-degrading endonuclease HigB of HigAB toxin-antitoxin module